MECQTESELPLQQPPLWWGAKSPANWAASIAMLANPFEPKALIRRPRARWRTPPQKHSPVDGDRVS